MSDEPPTQGLTTVQSNWEAFDEDVAESHPRSRSRGLYDRVGTTCATVPVTPESIGDRCNQLVGNVSLFQSLETVDFINELLVRDAFRPEFLRQFDVKHPLRIPRAYPNLPDRDYYIPFIEMSTELQAKLDYESKLDRSPENIGALMADGEKQARVFLKERV